jgi:hypothetical protein
MSEAGGNVQLACEKVERFLSEGLCPSIARGQPCRFAERCIFLHLDPRRQPHAAAPPMSSPLPRAAPAAAASPSPAAPKKARPVFSAAGCCPKCGKFVDVALRDGHLESCRGAPGGGSSSFPPQPPSAPAPVVDDDTDVCIICLEVQRSIAFVPCGHLCTCLKCSASLKQCPICRAPTEGRLTVDEKGGLCKHCRCQVGPTYFHSHVEVCALQTKQRMAEGGASIHNKDTSNCVRCGVAKRGVALVPCGHRVFCHTCAEAVAAKPSTAGGNSVCPLCCSKIERTIDLFD